MVICPIARTVHCTGCVLLKICPVKTVLGDYGKRGGKSANQIEDEKRKDASRPKV